MMKNSQLNDARTNKRDEFYTLYEDVKKELCNYDFTGKVVYCNCDSEVSNFVKYFKNNFYDLGLSSLLYSDQDFRDPKSIELLKAADVVISNPPFSLLREYISQLVEYDKKFIIIGNQNIIKDKSLFPLIKENKVWFGYSGGAKWFMVPSEYKLYDGVKNFKFDDEGNLLLPVNNTQWITNFGKKPPLKPLDMSKSYYENTDDYPFFDNYNAINVDKVKDIPYDYYGVMGVPLTVLDKLNFDEFKILGITHSTDKSEECEALRTSATKRHSGFVNGVEKFPRILIERISIGGEEVGKE